MSAATYCEYATVGGQNDICVQGGVIYRHDVAVSLGLCAQHTSMALRMSPSEAHALAAHLIAAADRYEALHGVTP